MADLALPIGQFLTPAQVEAAVSRGVMQPQTAQRFNATNQTFTPSSSVAGSVSPTLGTADSITRTTSPVTTPATQAGAQFIDVEPPDSELEAAPVESEQEIDQAALDALALELLDEKLLNVGKAGIGAAGAISALNQELAANNSALQEEIVIRQSAVEAREREFMRSAEMNDRAAQEAQETYRKLSDEVSETKIDADHFWASRGTAGSIVSALAMAAGAYVEARSDGRIPNRALQMIDRAIERDVEIQKSNYLIKKDRAESARTLFSMAMERSRSIQEAKYHAISAGYQAANLSLQKYAAQTNNIQAKTQLAQVQASIEAQQQAVAAKAIEERQRRIREGYTARETIAMSDEQFAALQRESLHKDAAERFIAGSGFVRSAEVARDLDTAIVDLASGLEGVRDAKGLLRQAGSADFGRAGGEMQKALDQMSALLLGQVKNIILPGAGALADKELQTALSSIGNFQKWVNVNGPEEAIKRLDRLQSVIVGRVDKELKQKIGSGYRGLPVALRPFSAQMNHKQLTSGLTKNTLD